MIIFKLICVLLPWRIKRLALQVFFHYQLHASAHIGLAWVYPKHLVMAAGARIGHFTVAIHLDKLAMAEHATIGRSNWITGFPSGTASRHFSHQQERQSVLTIGASSAITKHHHIDCTNSITIGKFATIAGYQSQLLTHSIDVYENRQDSKPILIGDYSFVGTNVVVLGGSNLPSHSVLGAKSLLNKKFEEQWKVYAGVPAKAVADIPPTAKYFSRESGFVY